NCNAQNAGRLTYKTKAPFGALAILPCHTASFAAFTGRALMTFRAGLALNSIGSLVKGLIPWCALVAGFLMTTNFAKPGTKKAPVFLSSLYPMVASVSMTPLTSFFVSLSECSAVIFSISSDFVISFGIYVCFLSVLKNQPDSCEQTIFG